MIQLRDIIEIGKVSGFEKINNFVLHYMVYESKGPDGSLGFSVAGLELGFFSWAKTKEKAKNELFNLHSTYLLNDEVDEASLFYQLGEDRMSEWWALYRKVVFLFGDVSIEYKNMLEQKDQEINLLKKLISDLSETPNQLKKELDSIKVGLMNYIQNQDPSRVNELMLEKDKQDLEIKNLREELADTYESLNISKIEINNLNERIQRLEQNVKVG